MLAEKILVVDDEENIQELLNYNLTKNGYQVETVGTGEDALASIGKSSPALIILDLMLPGIDGLEVCRILKYDSRTSHIPILMLTAKGEETDIVAGLELGAVDYVTKPFSVNVLIARMRTILRYKSKGSQDKDSTVTVEKIMINPTRHEVIAGNKLIDLTHTEFKLLHMLALHRGRVFTRRQIVDALWDDEKAVTDRSVDVQIAGLRKKLGRCGNIQTVHGVGYKIGDE